MFAATPALSRANPDKLLNGERVKDEDVVLWYVSHFLHDESQGGGNLIAGTELRPFNR